MPPRRKPKKRVAVKRSSTKKPSTSLDDAAPNANTDVTTDLPPPGQNESRDIEETDAAADASRKRRARTSSTSRPLDGEPGPSKRNRFRQGSPTSATELPQHDSISDFPFPIDHRGFPDIFDQIFKNLLAGFDEDQDRVYRTLLSIRATSQELCERVDKVLLEHVIIAGKIPNGLSSRLGLIPYMCPEKFVRHTPNHIRKFIKSHPVRVCDFAGIDFNNTAYQHELKKQLKYALDVMPAVQVFRHWDIFDLGYDMLPFRPTKVVRFLDVTKIWHERTDNRLHWSPPKYVHTLVLHMKYTHDWSKWTDFIDAALGNVRKIVFIFEPVDGPEAQPNSSPWRIILAGVLFPIITPLLWEIGSQPEVVFVGLPPIPPTWSGGTWGDATDLKGHLMQSMRQELLESTGLVPYIKQMEPEDVDATLARISFLTRQEYVATLTPDEYVEEFCWYGPMEDDGESLLPTQA